MKKRSSWCVLLLLVLTECGGSSENRTPVVDAGNPDGFGEGGVGADAADTPKRVFITSETFTGDLGGLAGADAKCLASATGARLGGQWVAFVSTATSNAIDRIVDRAPWYDTTGGKLLFGTKSEMSQTPRANLTTDEHRAVYESVSIWTATESGTFLAASCVDWTSAAPTELAVFGSDGTSANAILWSVGGIGSEGQTGCDSRLHLLCFEQ